MTYPDGIDALVNVNANDTLAAGGHAARHNSVNTALVEVKDYLVGALGSKLDLAGGKILQIVRATDATTRTTNSTSLTDVTGMAVTITPQKSDSAIWIIVFGAYRNSASIDDLGGQFIITDSSNNSLSGGAIVGSGNLTGTGTRSITSTFTMTALDNPATTSPVTYKLRFAVFNTSTAMQARNGEAIGQIYAIEVSA
jgi:hypothetical protein